MSDVCTLRRECPVAARDIQRDMVYYWGEGMQHQTLLACEKDEEGQAERESSTKLWEILQGSKSEGYFMA
jgi:hypothetical protein